MGKLAESRTEGAANLEIWKSARADAWLAYHNGIFATSHYEGALTSEDISSVATAALKGHKIRGGNVNTKSILDASSRLAHTLALQGSPAMIMMQVKEATEKNVTVIPGGAGQETLENAAVLERNVIVPPPRKAITIYPDASAAGVVVQPRQSGKNEFPLIPAFLK